MSCDAGASAEFKAATGAVSNCKSKATQIKNGNGKSKVITSNKLSYQKVLRSSRNYEAPHPGAIS
jgi:hypothetical protein